MSRRRSRSRLAKGIRLLTRAVLCREFSHRLVSKPIASRSRSPFAAWFSHRGRHSRYRLHRHCYALFHDDDLQPHRRPKLGTSVGLE